MNFKVRVFSALLQTLRQKPALPRLGGIFQTFISRPGYRVGLFVRLRVEGSIDISTEFHLRS